LPQRRSSFGWPILLDLPAARRTAPTETGGIAAGSLIDVSFLVTPLDFNDYSGFDPTRPSQCVCQRLYMKWIAYLTGLAAMLAITGCEWDEHEHHHDYRGGAYDGTDQGYGYQTYPYPPPAYPDDHEYWEHHGYRY
jgi:hypothetical protein